MPQTPLFEAALFNGIGRPEFSKSGFDRSRSDSAAARTAFNDVLSSAQTRARDLAETVQQRRADEKRLEERRLEEKRAAKNTDESARGSESAAPAEEVDETKKRREAANADQAGQAAPVAPKTVATAQTDKTETPAAEPVEGTMEGEAEGKAAATEPAATQSSDTAEGPAAEKAPATNVVEDGDAKTDAAQARTQTESQAKTAEAESPSAKTADAAETAPTEATADAKATAELDPDAAPNTEGGTAGATDVSTAETTDTATQQATTTEDVDPTPQTQTDKPAAPAAPPVENVAERQISSADGLAAAKEARAAVEAERHGDADTPYVAPTARGGDGAGSTGGNASSAGNGGQGGANGVSAAAQNGGTGADGQSQQQGGQPGQQRAGIDPALLAGLTNSRAEPTPASPPADFRVAMTQAQAGTAETAAKSAGEMTQTTTPQSQSAATSTAQTSTALGQMTSLAQPEAAKAAEQARSMMAQRTAESDPARQVAAQIRHAKEAGLDTFKIQLNPAELGSVSIEMKVAKDGQLKALIVVEKAETLDTLQRDQRALERALNEAGLKTDHNSLEFSLRDPAGQSRQQFAGDDGRPGRGGFAGQPEDEPMIAAGPVRRLDALVDVSI